MESVPTLGSLTFFVAFLLVSAAAEGLSDPETKQITRCLKLSS